MGVRPLAAEQASDPLQSLESQQKPPREGRELDGALRALALFFSRLVLLGCRQEAGAAVPRYRVVDAPEHTEPVDLILLCN